MRNVNNHKFIIWGTYGANVLGQIRSLGEKGIRPIAVLYYKNSFRIDKSKYLSKVHNVNSIEDGLDLILRLYGNEEYKPFIYTDSDAVMGCIDRNLDLLTKKFYVWNGGEQGRLNRYLNKAEQIRCADESGIRVPKTERVKIGELPKNLKYPIFTKATDSLNYWWKGFASICYTEEELVSFYHKIKDISEIIIQEYIDKSEELPIEGISLKGGDEIIILGRTVYYRLMNDSYGTYRYVEPFEDKELEAKIKNLIQKFHYTGPFQIEFIIDKQGIVYYLETNFRIAQQDYAFSKLGANIPYLYAISTLTNQIEKKEIQIIPKQKVSIMTEFDDFKKSVLHGQISLLQWIKDLYNSDCLQYFNKNDMAPFFWTIFSKLFH